MDFCQNPSLLHGHGAFWYDVAHGSRMAPYFVMSKLEQGGELLLPALAGWKDRSNQTIPTWSERTDSRLFWRGRSTGAFFNRHRRWWDAHRTSLHRMANSIDLADDLVDVLVESQDGKGLVRQRYERQVLNEKYLDVGLVGKPTQCSVEDGTCAEMSKDVGFLPLAPGTAGLSGKYSLDVGKCVELYVAPSRIERTFRWKRLVTAVSEALGIGKRRTQGNNLPGVEYQLVDSVVSLHRERQLSLAPGKEC